MRSFVRALGGIASAHVTISSGPAGPPASGNLTRGCGNARATHPDRALASAVQTPAVGVRGTRALALAIAGVVALAACGDGGAAPVDATSSDGDATPRETITETVPLAVTEIVEAILHGGPGDYARIRLTAPGPSLDWNLHGHAGGTAQVVEEELQVSAVDYMFVPAAEADWYLLLRNRGQTDIDVQLIIELYGEMTWSGWQ